MKKLYVVKAFTLTEVLLAVAIVGIIAALVLPMVSTHYQNELYNHAYKREIDTIESAVEGLSVNENKANFFDTMMYTSSEPEDYKESSEKFLRKYVKTTKICSEAKDCFAQEYYEYTKDEQNRNVKKEYKPEYKGSCGILKNGMSMCITPQIGGEGIHGIIDLNGKKGPNVHNRDLREFSLSSRTRVGMNTETEAVRSLDWENMGENPPVDPCEGLTCGCGSLPACNPCDTNPDGFACCQTKNITNRNDPCCNWSLIYDSVEACQPGCNGYRDGTIYSEAEYCLYIVPRIDTSVCNSLLPLGTNHYSPRNICKKDINSGDLSSAADVICTNLLNNEASMWVISDNDVADLINGNDIDQVPSGWYWLEDSSGYFQMAVYFPSGQRAYKDKSDSSIHVMCIGNTLN